CATVNGITAYCAARDSYPAIDLYGGAGNLKRLICVQKYHADTIGEQAAHIVRGVEQGLADALIAAAPYLGPATEGVACLNGVVFACAALGLDALDALAAHKVVPLPDAAKNAIPIAHTALDCAGGDYVSCAELGQQGLKEISGIQLPAAD